MASETPLHEEAMRQVKVLVAMGISEMTAIGAVTHSITQQKLDTELGTELISKRIEALHDEQVRIDHQGP